MHRSARSLVLLLLMVLPSEAIVVKAQEHHVSRSNAHEFGIEVHVRTNESACPGGREFWISSPKGATSAVLSIANESGGTLLSAPLALIELPPEPMLVPGHQPPEHSSPEVQRIVEEMQREHGFLAPGFRGTSFCIAPAHISQATFSFLVHLGTNRLLTEVYELGALSHWLE